MPQRKKSSSSKSDSIKLYQILKKDHEKVKDLFSQIEESEGMDVESRDDIFSQIESELNEHMEKEENYFYPAFEEDGDAREKVLESYEEHHVAKVVLQECSDLSSEDEHWLPKVKVLKEIVDHHIEEEEKELFKMATKSLGKDRLEEIADQMEEST